MEKCRRASDGRSKWLRLYTLVFMLLTGLFMTQTAYAKDTYYLIQVTVNQETWLVDGAVVADEVGATTSQLEAKRFSTDELKDLAENSSAIQGNKLSGLGESKTTPLTSGLLAKKNLVLTFPGKTIAAGSRAVGGSGTDQSRAETIKNGLVFDLNEAITLCFPDRSSWSMTEFEAHMDELLNAVRNRGTVNGASFSNLTSDEFKSIGRIDTSVVQSDYVKLTIGGRYHYLLWRMPKGYVTSAFTSGRVAPTGLTGTANSDEDAPFINWEMLLYEAVGNSLISGDLGVSSGTVTQGTTSQLGTALSNVVGGLCDHIRGILGLWSLDQLIYNAGNRGTNSYIYGLFPATWENTIWGFFAISELLSIIFLFYSLIVNVLRRAAATTNFMNRLRMWEQTKDMLLVAVCLAILPLVVQVAMSLSFNLTGIIKGAASGKSLSEMRDSFSATASLGAAVVQFMYLGIDIYYNFFYLLRSLMVALPIILGPICLVAMTFDNKYKMMSAGWARELLANIVIQPIHALVFTIILLFPASSHRFDVIIMAYATIPLTGAVRSLLLGSSGGMTDMLSGKGKERLTGAMKGVASGAIGAAAGGVATTIAGRKQAGNEEEQENTGRAAETGTSQMQTINQQSVQTAQGASAGNSISGAIGTFEPENLGAETAQRADIPTAREESPAPEESTGPTQQRASLPSIRAMYDNIPQGAKDIVKGSAGMVWGAAKTAAGIGLGGVMGGVTGATGMQFGKPLVSGTQHLIASGFHSVGAGVSTLASGAHLTAQPATPTQGEDGGQSEVPTASAPDQGSGLAVGDLDERIATDMLESAYAGEDKQNGIPNDPLLTYGEKEDYGSRMRINMDEQAMTTAGIYNVRGDRDTLTFRASGESGKLYEDYYNTAQSLPEQQQKQLEAATGVSVHPVTRGESNTGDYTVTINKEQFRQATGTSIWTTKGVSGFSLESKNSATYPVSMVPRTKATRTTSNTSTAKEEVERGNINYRTAAAVLNHGVENNSPYAQRVEQANSQPVIVHSEEPTQGANVFAPEATAANPASVSADDETGTAAEPIVDGASVETSGAVGAEVQQTVPTEAPVDPAEAEYQELLDAASRDQPDEEEAGSYSEDDNAGKAY